MDFAKAFDHIDHNTLLRKLSSMSVQRIIINWITNLAGREQRQLLKSDTAIQRYSDTGTGTWNWNRNRA